MYSTRTRKHRHNQAQPKSKCSSGCGIKSSRVESSRAALRTFDFDELEVHVAPLQVSDREHCVHGYLGELAQALVHHLRAQCRLSHLDEASAVRGELGSR